MLKKIFKSLFSHKKIEKSSEIVKEYFVKEKVDDYLEKIEDLYSIMKYYIDYNNYSTAIDTYKSILNYREKTEPYLHLFNRQQKYFYNNLQLRFNDYIVKIEKLLVF